MGAPYIYDISHLRVIKLPLMSRHIRGTWKGPHLPGSFKDEGGLWKWASVSIGTPKVLETGNSLHKGPLWGTWRGSVFRDF